MPNTFTTNIRRAIAAWRPRAGNGVVQPPDQIEVPTPIYVSQRVRTVIIFATIIVFIWLARLLPNIVTTVLIGATVALVLSFPVRFLQRFMSRKASIAIVTIGMIVTAVGSIALAIPFLVSEITQFVQSLPDTLETSTNLLRDMLDRFYQRGWIDRPPDSVIEDMQNGILGSGEGVFTAILGNVVATLSQSFDFFIGVFGVIFVSVYLLADIPTFKDAYVRMWAPRYRRDAVVLWETVGFSLSRYLSGLMLSLAIQGVLATIGLSLLGVPYALILGIIVSVTAILPYIGAFLSAVPAILIALTISWQTAIGVVILYILINQLEGNFITPRIQGNAVRVHPILIFMGVIAGSRLFGMLGAIMAVPTIAILRVVLEFFYLRLRVSEERPTVLSIMRLDSIDERISNQSPLADEMDDEEVTDAEIAEAVAPSDEPPPDTQPLLLSASDQQSPSPEAAAPPDEADEDEEFTSPLLEELAQHDREARPIDDAKPTSSADAPINGQPDREPTPAKRDSRTTR